MLITISSVDVLTTLRNDFFPPTVIYLYKLSPLEKKPERGNLKTSLWAADSWPLPPGKNLN